MIVTNETIKLYRTWLDTAKYSVNTTKNYTYYISKLLGQDINQATIEQLCGSSHAVYRSFLKTLLICFKIDKDIVIPTIRGRTQQKAIVYYTQDEMDYILNHTQDARLYLIISLMYELGLRVSEVMNIRRMDIDTINKRIRGVGKGRKEFNMKVSDRLFKILQAYIVSFGKEDKVFIWEGLTHQRQKVLYELKQHISKLLPYKNEHHIFCHAFRHTCGTHLRESGIDLREIQTYLRHSKLETVAAYTAVDKFKLEKKIEQIFK